MMMSELNTSALLCALTLISYFPPLWMIGVKQISTSSADTLTPILLGSKMIASICSRSGLTVLIFRGYHCGVSHVYAKLMQGLNVTKVTCVANFSCVIFLSASRMSSMAPTKPCFMTLLVRTAARLHKSCRKPIQIEETKVTI